MELWAILVLVFGGLLALFLVLFVVFRLVGGALRRREAAVRERFPHARLVVGANFFGQESRGAGQIRGNGTLVLTDAELYFEQLTPRREFHIPLASVQAVETVRWHLGKSVGRPLLKVAFTNDAGAPDSIAWWVRDLDGLRQALQAARG